MMSCADGIQTTWRVLLLLALCAVPCTAARPQDAAQAPEQAVEGPSSSEAIQPRVATAEALTQDVRDTLSRYGHFVQNDTYGEVWIPTVTPQGWHPYPPCHWIKARRLGLYYDDQTEWGKIVHHYGRWAHDAQMGWVWIGANEFSPGWVVWRSSAQWTGWAPLPPQQANDVATADAMGGADSWLFQETPRFLAGCQADQIAPAAQAISLMPETPFVRTFGVFEGIGVFIVPTWIAGPFVDVGVSFKGWSNWFLASVVVKWNWVWHHTTIAKVQNVCIRKL